MWWLLYLFRLKIRSFAGSTATAVGTAYVSAAAEADAPSTPPPVPQTAAPGAETGRSGAPRAWQTPAVVSFWRRIRRSKGPRGSLCAACFHRPWQASLYTQLRSQYPLDVRRSSLDM